MQIKDKLDLIYITSHFPPDIGGLETTMGEMVKENLKFKDRVMVVTGKDKTKDYFKEDHVVRFNRFEILRNLFIIPRLFLYLLKTNYEIYYVHYGNPPLLEIGFFISKIKLRKFVIHVHLDLFGSTKVTKFLFKIYNQTIVRFMLKSADAIITPTNSYRIYISKKYSIDRKKIHYSMPTINKQRYLHLKKQTHNGYNILFVGGLRTQKNVPLLINAFDILASKYGDINLLIVGTGIQEQEIKSLAFKKKNSDRILFIGQVSHNELPEYYMKSDLFALSSLTESAGIVILEAFAAKVPVVATKCLGVIDLIGKDRGVLVKNGDVKSLAEGIEKVYLKKVNVQKIVEKAYNYVNNYSWTIIDGGQVP